MLNHPTIERQQNLLITGPTGVGKTWIACALDPAFRAPTIGAAFALIFNQNNHYNLCMRGGPREGAGRPKGAKNQRIVAVEKAMRGVAEELKQAVPDTFEGDGVAYMRSVYRDPSFSHELRLDAAAKAARVERPTLAA